MLSAEYHADFIDFLSEIACTVMSEARYAIFASKMRNKFFEKIFFVDNSTDFCCFLYYTNFVNYQRRE